MHHGATDPTIPILFLPGLNGDPRVFGSQSDAFPSMTVARWLPPEQSESLTVYAERLARTLDPGGPCIVGGVSFGGIVALELAHHLDARACLLMASTRDVHGLPAAVRFLRPLAGLASLGGSNWLTRHGEVSAARVSPRFGHRLGRLSADELNFRRWAFRAMLKWRPPKSMNFPVLQIHGECDSTFRASRTKADVLVPHAGHLLTLTHREQVNALIRSAVEKYAA